MRRRHSSLGLAWLVAAVLVTLFPVRIAGQLLPAREYEIKAGFLYNFARFVEWPPDAFQSESEDLRLEVSGHDPFDGALDRLVAGKSVNQHRFTIVYSARAAAAPRGHLVFVSASEQKRLAGVLTAFKQASALTVSDIDGFAERGGVIGLVTSGNAVKFVINRGAANEARLRVSSRLLSLATVLDRDTARSMMTTPDGLPLLPNDVRRTAR